jgi:hypothetical protein
VSILSGNLASTILVERKRARKFIEGESSKAKAMRRSTAKKRESREEIGDRRRGLPHV